jgi:Protein of unknown function (DUF3140)
MSLLYVEIPWRLRGISRGERRVAERQEVDAMAHHVEVDLALWEEFHRVVNMTSRELMDWLRTRSADEGTEELPDQAGTKTGRAVLDILQKRRVDLTDEDERVMRNVVDRIHAERRDDLEPTAGQENWRHRLMTIGHDPLKPPR